MAADRPTPIRVLLVEDNPGDARLVELQLSVAYAGPFEVRVVERLSKALETLEQASFEVALLDLSLPDAQGLSIVERIRARAPDLPVIVLTGFGEDALREQAAECGARGYLIKGEDTEERIAATILDALAAS